MQEKLLPGVWSVCVSRASFASPVPPIEGVQRGSPPQADAEGLAVDSPQDEGCPPILRNFRESPFAKGGPRGLKGASSVNFEHFSRHSPRGRIASHSLPIHISYCHNRAVGSTIPRVYR